MDLLGNISTNLAAAAIGAIVVASWHAVVRWRRFRGARGFWAPFIAGECICVTGNTSPQLLSRAFLQLTDDNAEPSTVSFLPALQEHIRDQERSGLMGRGDHDAVVQIQAGLVRIGLASIVTERTGRLTSEELRKNLILVGGPDVNPATADLLAQLPGKLFVTHNAAGRNVIRDDVHDHEYSPGVGSNGRYRDYGILIRAKNPRDRARAVLIVAGAQGFGSIAAAEMAFSSEVELYLRQHSLESGFECLVCHEREGEGDDENPFSRSFIIFIRPLPTSGA